MPPLRLVLDNNVVVSTLLFPLGRLSWLRLAWQASEFVPLASPATLSELQRVIGYPKFGVPSHRLPLTMNQYRPWCKVVTIAEPPDVPECRDPRDRPFLELAVAAQADALVTGDGDLLTLAPVFAVPIITPTDLMARLEYDRLETDDNR